jgi:hypothetical protein
VSAENDLLRHFLAAIAYRTQKALRDAPKSFPDFDAGHQLRTPVQILRHMTSVLGYARTFFVGGTYPSPDPLPTFGDEMRRFHQMLEDLAGHLSSGTPLIAITPEQLLQGPFADAMTHVGQLALLRRLADAPIPPENFVMADVRRDRLGMEQALPASPDAEWPERLRDC